MNQYFEGETGGLECSKSIPGIAYITSETIIAEINLTSRDRGYSSASAWFRDLIGHIFLIKLQIIHSQNQNNKSIKMNQRL